VFQLNGSNFEMTAPYAILLDTLPEGASVSEVALSYTFFQSGNSVDGDDATGAGDVMLTAALAGAGVYVLQSTYTLSNGDQLVFVRLVKVNGLGAVLADIQYNGIQISNVDGLNADLTSLITQSGQAETIRWAWATSDFSQNGALGTGTNLSATIDQQAELIVNYVDLNASVWGDLPISYINNPASFGIYSAVHITT
jgi:hypothetical protein